MILVGEASDEMSVPCDLSILADLHSSCVVSGGIALSQQVHYLQPVSGTNGCRTVQRHTNNRHQDVLDCCEYLWLCFTGSCSLGSVWSGCRGFKEANL